MSNTVKDAGLVLALIGTIAGGVYKFVQVEAKTDALEIRLGDIEKALAAAVKTDASVARFVDKCTDTFTQVVEERKLNGGSNFAEQTTEMLYKLECDKIIDAYVNK